MRHITLIIFTVIILFYSETYSQELSQTVRGKIVESITKSPIEGAVIRINTGKEKAGAESSKDGSFSIENIPPGRHDITVTMTGYNPVVLPNVLVSTGKETNLSIEMESAIISTDEIVVTDEIEKDKSSNPYSITSSRSFSIDETKRFAGTFDDPMRAVQNFAGVVSTPNVNTNGIVIRGNSPKGLLWRLDEVDIPSPNHFSYAGQKSGGLTIFSSQLLTNSDFYTSAFPSEYGNALSGVFDMKFRNGNSFKREYTLQLGIQGIEFAAEGPFAKNSGASYLLNYRYSVFGFLQLIDKDMKNKVPGYQDLSFKVNLPTEKYGTFTLFGIGGIDNSRFNPDLDSTKWEKLDDRTKTVLNNKTGTIGLAYSVPVDGNTLFKTIISARTQQVDYEKGFVNSDYNTEPTDNVNYSTSGISIYSYLHHKFSPQHSNKTGIRYTQMYFDAKISSQNQFTGAYEEFINDKGNTGLIQAFTESNYNAGNRVLISGGINFTHFALNNSNTFEPRLSAKYNISGNQTISAGYGNHSQIEDVSVYLSGKKDADGVISNPNINLKPGRANHFVLGYDVMFSKNLHMKIEGYYQYLYDIPVMRNSYYSMLNNPGGYFNDSLVNTGSGRNAGIDITFEKFLSDNYYYLLTATLFNSKYKGGDGIERNGRYNGNFAFNLLGGKEFITKSGNIWSLNLKASYTGGEYYIPVDLQGSMNERREVLDYSQVYTQRLKSFLYIDLTAAYRINYKKSSLIFTAQAKNILNQKVVLGYSYNNYSKSVDEQTELGLVPMVSVRYEF
ncbi:MAG: TonB-dependent receptor [Ignavibacteria bacterium]|nr:TonB-dependent receptor [Ignavibacteria bacterium]